MQFDVVISDLNLPGKLNGIDILDALKTITRRIKAILITGRGSEEIKSKVNSLGALYLEKPLQLKEMSMYRVRFSSPHLVPVVGRHFHFHFAPRPDLSQRDEVVEGGFSRALHLEKPLQLQELETALEWRVGRQPSH